MGDGAAPTASGAAAGGGGAPAAPRAALRQAEHAHYSALQHLLGLWARGVEVPGLS